jgi:hypothetical protein
VEVPRQGLQQGAHDLVDRHIKRIADGLTDNKRSKRAQKVLPAGAALWAWDADPDFDEKAGEQWLFLLPKKWNPTKHTQRSTAGATTRASVEPRTRPPPTSDASVCGALSMSPSMSVLAPALRERLGA